MQHWWGKQIDAMLAGFKTLHPPIKNTGMHEKEFIVSHIVLKLESTFAIISHIIMC